MKIVITDCDHDSTAVEQQVAETTGAELVLAQCRSEEDVIVAAAGADAIVVQYAPITARVMDALPSLKAVGRYGVGVDTVDVPAATVRGIAVCNVPDYGTEDVSDHAIALALTLARGTAQFDRRVRRGEYDLSPLRPLHRVNTLLFGVVGLGLIGTATARKAKGIGYTVVACDPRYEAGITTEQGINIIGYEDLIASADVISLHVPLMDSTRHLINEQALMTMKDGATLINTCRGGVVDTDALAKALASGRLAGAGLDVFEEEPLSAASPLLDFENVVLTPHAAWYSEESYSELKRRTVENVVDVCAGRAPRNILNPEAIS